VCVLSKCIEPAACARNTNPGTIVSKTLDGCARELDQLPFMSTFLLESFEGRRS
jgi:hypothetical protein